MNSVSNMDIAKDKSPTAPYRVALVGNPNCGKSALFNSLTGLRQKVANYPGATVERRTGSLKNSAGIELIDLPGTYSLSPKSPDEEITHDVLKGFRKGEARPDFLVCVLDSTNLAHHLAFAIELKTLNLPMVIALNMTDLADREKIKIDVRILSEALCLPVIPTIAVRQKGVIDLIGALTQAAINHPVPNCPAITKSLKERQQEARSIAHKATLSQGIGHRSTQILDQVLLDPFFGMVFFLSIMFLMFQAVFSWAEAPMDWIETTIIIMQGAIDADLSDGPLKSLINDGILAGVGAVIVFLPQIIILFAFILVLESTGYMARAAVLMDRLMASVGLNGRSFIPLLSSFACAIPGIMAARTIQDPKDRLTTILIAPLMTCSARLPVYTLIIAAFIPNDTILWGFAGLQGFVFFVLYMMGIVSALLVAFILKRTIAKGAPLPFIMELPKYQIPRLRFVLTGLFERVRLFLKRAGTIIMASTVILWLMASYPFPPEGATEPDISYTLVGIIGEWLAVIFAPIGFGWEISVALVPGMAAREVAISALGTVYALSGNEDIVADQLKGLLAVQWSLPTALSFLAWFVFAPQCFSTIAVTRRETNSWKWPLFMVGYLFALAYLVSFITFQLTSYFMQ